MADTCQESDDVGLHAQCDDPWHQCYGKHASADSKRRRSECKALPEVRLWDEAVPQGKSKCCNKEKNHARIWKVDGSHSFLEFADLKNRYRSVEDEAEGSNDEVDRSNSR